VGWVNVGVDHDTASFAVEGIRQWWSGIKIIHLGWKCCHESSLRPR
jgi:Rhodopirellula transposase DDE domain